VELLTDPNLLSRQVAERRHGYVAEHRGELPGGWRVECGPVFWRHLRKFALYRIPGWIVTSTDPYTVSVWDVPVVVVDAPEGWRLLEALPDTVGR
jgi:hypothetical protein